MISAKDFKFDDMYQTVKVCGIKYSYSLFEAFGEGGLKLHSPFRIINREDGDVVIQELPLPHTIITVRCNKCGWTCEHYYREMLKWENICQKCGGILEEAPTPNE